MMLFVPESGIAINVAYSAGVSLGQVNIQKLATFYSCLVKLESTVRRGVGKGEKNSLL